MSNTMIVYNNTEKVNEPWTADNNQDEEINEIKEKIYFDFVEQPIEHLSTKQSDISGHELFQNKLPKISTRTKKIRFDPDLQIFGENYNIEGSVNDESIFNECLARHTIENGQLPLEENGSIDNIFNQLMCDIDQWQTENNDLVHEPVEDIHQVLEQHDDIETKYKILLREYNSLRRKSTYSFADELDYLKSQNGQDVKIPLGPANFHTFTRKEYPLFFTVIVLCLLAVTFLGFYAVKEMEPDRLVYLSKLSSSPWICDTETFILNPAEPTYQPDVSRTTALSPAPQTCFDLFFFHLCARNTF
ncbi:hypothetical protein G9A89_017810 [Geosiphon pyriformis]|nr:hypothetical protein G9A89_017810 [Geosiphon pyriformis]